MSVAGWLVAAVALPVVAFAGGCLIFGPRAVARWADRWAERIDPGTRGR